MNPEEDKALMKDEEVDEESESESVVSTEIDDQPNNPDDLESDADEEDDDVDDDDEDDDDEDDDDEDVDDEDDDEKPVPKPPVLFRQLTEEEEDDDEDDDEDEDEDDDDENYLQKFDSNIRRDIIGEFHPELIQHNDEEVETLCKIVRDVEGNIVDPLHKTVPFITKYEKARILGERARQINAGAKPFIKTEKTLIDGYLIALREYEEKKIPFIVRRPLPNGGSEYWKLADLEMID
jgi:DNA-directed RNA polymerase subunit K/omega